MVKEDHDTRQNQLLDLLAEHGGSLGNGKAMELTGWPETEYLEVRQGLEVKGLLKRGRGRGGSIQLTNKARKAYISQAQGALGQKAVSS